MCEKSRRVTLEIIHEGINTLVIGFDEPDLRDPIVEAATQRTWRRLGGRYATLNEKSSSNTSIALTLAHYDIDTDHIVAQVKLALRQLGYEVKVRDLGDGIVGLG